MKTLQHATLFFMALMNKYRNEQDALTVFREEVPWLLLPDGIRAYIGPRQAGHFEETPDGKGISWMVYPSEDLKLNKIICLKNKCNTFIFIQNMLKYKT